MDLFDLKKVRLREPKESDYKTVIEEDEALDWNTTPSVIRTWMNPEFTNGFKVAEYEGKPVGFIMGYNFTENDSFIGFYVVVSELRGNGIGKLLWKWLLSYTEGRNIWLCSPDDNLDMYSQRGLQPIQPLVKIRQFNHVTLRNLRGTTPSWLHIQKLSDDDLPSLLIYDREICGYKRESFWKTWLKKEQCPTLLAWRNNKIVGFGMLTRAGDNYYRFEPLFADTAEIARCLIRKLTESLPEDATYVADFRWEEDCKEFLAEILPPGALDRLDYTLVLLSAGTSDFSGDSRKIYFYTQVDTLPS